MSPLQAYLERYFVEGARFARMCATSSNEMAELIRHRLIPKPSYVVADSHVASFVFGRMRADDAAEGEYFPGAHCIWVSLARSVVADVGLAAAAHELERRFALNLTAALRDLNASTWRLRDCFADDGSVIADGLRTRIDSMRTHFLEGTFGLCVADPSSEALIAQKEILQEKISALSKDGAKSEFTHTEARILRDTIDAYSRAAMPFSPIEYPLSSRKRLVDDLSARLDAAIPGPEKVQSSGSLLRE